MRWNAWTSPSILFLCLTSQEACGDAASPADTIPLDGRGGGILAYTLQPGGTANVHEIHVMNADGSGSRRMIQSSIGLNHHSWSPDARHMAAVGYHDQLQTWSVYTFDTDGENLTRLTNVRYVFDNEPSWSPDGSTIAFTRTYPAQNHRSEVWLMNADGTDQRWIGVEGFHVRWSPDGTRLIFQSRISEWTGGQSDLMTCAVDGSDVRAVTDTPEDELAPIWSPDGSQIAFVADYDGDFDVYVMDADGSDVRRLTESATDDWAPDWSPDGSMIAFGADATGTARWEVYVMNADGTSLRRVTDTPAPKTSINPRWCPDPG